MSKTTTVYPGGLGFGGVLMIVFLVLKLCRIIAWSWWWVMSPLWIPAAIFLTFAAFCLLMAFLCRR